MQFGTKQSAGRKYGYFLLGLRKPDEPWIWAIPARIAAAGERVTTSHSYLKTIDCSSNINKFPTVDQNVRIIFSNTSSNFNDSHCYLLEKLFPEYISTKHFFVSFLRLKQRRKGVQQWRTKEEKGRGKWKERTKERKSRDCNFRERSMFRNKDLPYANSLV
ncbi:hypothetical protein V1477_011647, partial [Vespula maculifrons]